MAHHSLVSRSAGSSSSIDLLNDSSGFTGVAVSSEFRAGGSFLLVLPGGFAVAALEDDFSRSAVLFSSSIDSLIGSFRACFFFYFLTASSSEDDDVESSDSNLDDRTLFFFFSSWEWYPYPIPTSTTSPMSPSRRDLSGSSSFASFVRIYLCL